MQGATGARLDHKGVSLVCWSQRRRGVTEGGVLRCSAGRRC